MELDASPFRVILTRHAPRLRLALHDHADPSINIVLHGGFEERIGRRTLHSAAGTLVVKPGGARHANRYGMRATVSLLIQAPLETLPALGALARAFGEIREVAGEAVRSLAHGIASRLAQPGGSLHASQAIWELLRRLVGEIRDPKRVSRAWVARVRDELASRALGPVHLASLASASGVDPATLSNAFRTTYGCTPREFIRRQRVAWASGPLRHSRRPLSAIALDAGFADQAHFTRSFKRETGLTPGQFRAISADGSDS